MAEVVSCRPMSDERSKRRRNVSVCTPFARLGRRKRRGAVRALNALPGRFRHPYASRTVSRPPPPARLTARIVGLRQLLMTAQRFLSGGEAVEWRSRAGGAVGARSGGGGAPHPPLADRRRVLDLTL